MSKTPFVTLRRFLLLPSPTVAASPDTKPRSEVELKVEREQAEREQIRAKCAATSVSFFVEDETRRRAEDAQQRPSGSLLPREKTVKYISRSSFSFFRPADQAEGSSRN
jgi:hypothetical protein